MNPAVAYLIYATATLSGFPAQEHSVIEWPSLAICEAKAREFRAALNKPAAVERRKRDKVTILIEPRCQSERPSFWINVPE